LRHAPLRWLIEMWVNRGLNQAGNDVQQQPDGTKNLYRPTVDLIFHAIIIASIMTIGFDKHQQLHPEQCQ
jgi:hypothetical protein